MALPKKLPKPPQAKVKPGTNSNPNNYLRGSKTVGQKYTAYNNYNQGKPDFGKGNGPGTPYHEVQQTVKKAVPGAGKPVTAGPPQPRNPNLPRWAPPGSTGKGSVTPGNIWGDARARAIKNRLKKAAF